MKITHIILPIFLLMGLNCGGGVGSADGGAIPLIEEPMTLEIAFGDNDEGEEAYLLAEPNGLGVNENGDIYTADENFIKVYDADGNPKTMFGGKGQGPGEFEAAMNLGVSPTGYVTVMNVLWEYSVFNPQHEYLDKVRLRIDNRFERHKEANTYDFTMMEDIVHTIDEKTSLIQYWSRDKTREGVHPADNMILLVTPDTLIEIVKFNSMISQKDQANPSSSFKIKFQGDFLWDIQSAKSLVYTHAYHLKAEISEKPFYSLRIFDLEAMTESEVKVNYTPVVIPEARKKIKPRFDRQGKLRVDRNKDVKDAVLSQTKYYPPLEGLKADGDLVFGFSFQENEESDHYVEVIDISKGKKIASAYFPFIPDIIKGGYAYRLKSAEDEFPVIEKYKINEKLYGK